MRTLVAIIVGASLLASNGACQHHSRADALAGAAPEAVTFPTSDDGLIHADLYGAGEHGVVLAHGGRFDKESWAAQARVLAGAGLFVLAIDLRGHGDSRPGTQDNDQWEGFALDVLGAMRFLRERGARRVSLVGGSMGGWAVARASVLAEPGEIDRLVLIAHTPIDQPEWMQGRKLFVVTAGDAYADGSLRLERIREQYKRAPGPKELVVLDGDAHAQFIFETDQGARLMEEIEGFLVEP